MLPRIRQLAVNRFKDHPWKTMSDAELLQSAGLISEDLEAGTKGYNLAAVMLLGRDDVIKSVSPAYRTDALLRKVNTDRYDDRLIVETNLIDSYDMLMGFAKKPSSATSGWLTSLDPACATYTVMANSIPARRRS